MYDPTGSDQKYHYIYNDYNKSSHPCASPTCTYSPAIDETCTHDLFPCDSTHSPTRSRSAPTSALCSSASLLRHLTHPEKNDPPCNYNDGKSTALIDADGEAEIPSICDYDTLSTLIHANSPTTKLTPSRPNSKDHDKSFLVHYYGFRFYSPGQGRWLNRDPINEPGGAVGSGGVEGWGS